MSSINLDLRIEIRAYREMELKWSGSGIGDVVYPRGGNIPENVGGVGLGLCMGQR